MTEIETGYVTVGEQQIYVESRGTGGTPLVVVHGGYGVTSLFGDLLDALAAGRRVVAVELQGHGHTADVDRPFSWEGFGDDVAAVVTGLDLGRVDLLGYSLGGGVCLRTTIQHPELVRRLVVVAAPHRSAGYHPEVLAQLKQSGAGQLDTMRQTPMYDAYVAVAPDVDAFGALVAKSGELLRVDYDWSEQVRDLATPTLLVVGDADIVSPAEAAAFFALLGGGRRDGGWDRSGVGRHRLAVLPGVTHYEAFDEPNVGTLTATFLDGSEV